MPAGIIFFEDGSVEMIGKLNTARLIAVRVQEVIPSLLQQERQAIIDTLSDDELKAVIDRYAQQKQKETVIETDT